MSDSVERTFSVVANIAKAKKFELINYRPDLCEFDIASAQAADFIGLLDSLGFKNISRKLEPAQLYKKSEVIITTESFLSRGVLRVQFDEFME